MWDWMKLLEIVRGKLLFLLRGVNVCRFGYIGKRRMINYNNSCSVFKEDGMVVVVYWLYEFFLKEEFCKKK